MTNFLTNVTTTENGQLAFNSTLNSVLDLFYKLGSSRGTDLTDAFLKALSEDVDLTARALLWSRDVRKGAGERDHFRALVPILIKNLDASSVSRLIAKTPELGRYDDLLLFWGTEYEKEAAKFWVDAIAAKNALAAKWAPRKDKKGAKPLRNAARMTEKSWRQLLALASDTVEQKLCAGKVEEINFNHVPSLAAKRYKSAFKTKDEARYTEYLEGLATGKTKVNAGAIYPYEIISGTIDELAEAQWKALPEWDFGAGTLPIIDVSGSMCQPVGNTTALNVAVSLGLYASERCSGSFKDTFITFSEKPTLVNLSGHKSLADRVRAISSSDWGMSTDIAKVYKLILEYAVMQSVSQDQMPKRLLIISDMQFNQACQEGTIMSDIRAKFEEAGYSVPKVIFWQVNHRDGGVPITSKEDGTALISGFSPSIIRAVLSDDLNPVNAMKSILMEERYAI